MEGISANVYKGIKSYWKKRGYKRLNEPETTKPVHGKRRRFWRVKISRRVRVFTRFGSPKKWLTRLRDAYVNMMLNLSNSGLVGSTGFGGSIDYGPGFGKPPVKEYDEKVIVEIYKSILMQGQLVPREAAKICSRPPVIQAR